MFWMNQLFHLRGATSHMEQELEMKTQAQNVDVNSQSVRRGVAASGYVAHGRFRPPPAVDLAGGSASVTTLELYETERTSDTAPRAHAFDPYSL